MNVEGVPREKLERVREYDNDDFPSYVTKEWNPELWRPFLDEIGCDPASISLFITLNGCTNDGPVAEEALRRPQPTKQQGWQL